MISKPLYSRKDFMKLLLSLLIGIILMRKHGIIEMILATAGIYAIVYIITGLL